MRQMPFRLNDNTKERKRSNISQVQIESSLINTMNKLILDESSLINTIDRVQ
jgi:hypothetical protein